MRDDVIQDWMWSDGYLSEIRRILAINAFHLLDFEVAAGDADLKRATDMLIKVSGEKAIAVRLRRPYYNYRDLTIRAERASGVATELEKLRQGYGDYYLYGWIHDDKYIGEWMLVDLHRLRASGLLDRSWVLRRNKDGRTAFIAIPHTILREHNCIVAAEIYPIPIPSHVNDVPF